MKDFLGKKSTQHFSVGLKNPLWFLSPNKVKNSLLFYPLRLLCQTPGRCRLNVTSWHTLHVTINISLISQVLTVTTYLVSRCWMPRHNIHNVINRFDNMIGRLVRISFFERGYWVHWVCGCSSCVPHNEPDQALIPSLTCCGASLIKHLYSIKKVLCSPLRWPGGCFTKIQLSTIVHGCVNGILQMGRLIYQGVQGNLKVQLHERKSVVRACLSRGNLSLDSLKFSRFFHTPLIVTT